VRVRPLNWDPYRSLRKGGVGPQKDALAQRVRHALRLDFPVSPSPHAYPGPEVVDFDYFTKRMYVRPGNGAKIVGREITAPVAGALKE
jgi:hypothetical protein